MKIIPFKQNDTRITSNRTPLNTDLSLDFQKTLDRALKSSFPAAARDRVVAENRKALKNASDGDLGEAQGLLARLTDSLKEAGPGKLDKVHNLEGVLYFFQA